MFNVYNFIEISHHNDQFCLFYPKNDSSFSRFLDLSDGALKDLVSEPKKLEVFGGHLLSEDDHSHWALPYWNVTKETFSLGRTEI